MRISLFLNSMNEGPRERHPARFSELGLRRASRPQCGRFSWHFIHAGSMNYRPLPSSQLLQNLLFRDDFTWSIALPPSLTKSFLQQENPVKPEASPHERKLPISSGKALLSSCQKAVDLPEGSRGPVAVGRGQRTPLPHFALIFSLRSEYLESNDLSTPCALAWWGVP